MKLFIIKITIAVVAFSTVFLFLQRLLVPKYATFALEGNLIHEYYNSPMNQDLIMLGDCEVYANFSTIALWEEFGITSFIRGSPNQLVWQSYYLLEDTLRFAGSKPQVVVFNIMAMQYGEPENEAYNRLTLDGMRWSPTKIRAIAASQTPDEDWLSYFFPFFRFKENWQYLDSEDFRYFFRNPQVSVNGFMVRSDVVPVGFIPDPLRLHNFEFSDKSMYYLERMVRLTEEHDIRLVLIKAPNLFPYWHTEWDEQIIAFAEEFDLPYINFLNYEEKIGLDWDKHSFNAGLHLNVFGARLMSHHFGAILQEDFNLPDRRTQPDTAAYWNVVAEQYHRLIEVQQYELAQYGAISTFLIS